MIDKKFFHLFPELKNIVRDKILINAKITVNLLKKKHLTLNFKLNQPIFRIFNLITLDILLENQKLLLLSLKSEEENRSKVITLANKLLQRIGSPDANGLNNTQEYESSSNLGFYWQIKEKDDKWITSESDEDLDIIIQLNNNEYDKDTPVILDFTFESKIFQLSDLVIIDEKLTDLIK